MNRTLLLDLDDTLLRSNMDTFIPKYFQMLSDNLKDIVNPEMMIAGLMKGTKMMLKKTTPKGTLSEVFAKEFYAMIQVSEEELAARLDYFYDQVFPELGYLTSKIPGAVDLVENAFKENDRVIIATNPLFPLKAVDHRLRWAGLAPEDYQFSLVTAFEDFHFTKENLAYFPEIMGRVGWPEGPVVMVGNDYDMDITPAMKAGFPTFWVPDGSGSISTDMNIPTGLLQDVYPWMEDQNLETLSISYNEKTSLRSTLAATPTIFHGWLNPKGKYIPSGIESVRGKVEEVIASLEQNEIKNLNNLLAILGSENTDQFMSEYRKESIVGLGNPEKISTLNEFIYKRQNLLDLIDDSDKYLTNDDQNKMPEVVEFLKCIVSEDISYIRIANQYFQ